VNSYFCDVEDVKRWMKAGRHAGRQRDREVLGTICCWCRGAELVCRTRRR
jgi:hypothetical protein